jgi:hypothetical protein
VSTEVTVLDSVFLIDAPRVLEGELGLLGFTPGRTGGPQHLLQVRQKELLLDGRRVEGMPPGTPALDAVLMVLNATALAETDCYAVHAGVVAKNGRAAAFPALSGAGKSTLTAACVRLGLDYVSDEALLVRDDRSIRPYRKPLCLSRWTLERLGLPLPPAELSERPVAPSELSAASELGSLQLTHVLRLERSPVNQLMPLSRGDAGRMLLERSFNHFHDPARAFRLATGLAAGASVATLAYDDPLRAAALLADLLSSAPAPARDQPGDGVALPARAVRRTDAS